jgi:quinol monooxygenase YgiN
VRDKTEASLPPFYFCAERELHRLANVTSHAVERSFGLAAETPNPNPTVKAVPMAAINDLLEKNMSKLALYVPLEAKPGKEKEVAEFLKSALPLVDAEPGTVSWFAIQNGPSSFAIFDTFDDENGRNAHLSGKVAAALMAKAGELLAKPPAIHRIDILADKLPKK